MDDPGVVLFTLGNLHSLLRMHWDQEPTPNPSQEGTGQDADECLLPSWEGSGVGSVHGECVQLAGALQRARRNSTTKVAPLPGSLSHHTRPFMASTIFLTMDNPRPVAGSPAVGLALGRANLPNSFF